jgi:cation:H+ antiporter
VDIFLNFFLIILGFIFLIKGADFLVSGASSLARKFNVAEIAIGLTVVAMGTSAPELVVNVISSVENHDEVVFGNIIGSNIFNMFLILGVAGNIYPLVVQKQTVRKEIPFAILITIVLIFLVNDQFIFGDKTNSLSILDGIILLILFVVFLVNVFYNMQKSAEVVTDSISEYSTPKTVIALIVGMIGLAVGGELIVENSVSVASKFGVSQKMIGLTIIAAGTSLPELATTAVASFQKKSDIAVGNIVGSNVFNILLVLGLSSVIAPLNFNTVLNVDLSVVLFGSCLLLLFMFSFNKNRLDRIESVFYLMGFIAYMIFLFVREQPV